MSLEMIDSKSEQKWLSAKRNKAHFGWSVFLLLVVCALGVLLEDPWQDQITMYPVVTYKGKLSAFSRITFKILPATQTVVFWTPGLDDISHPFGKCSVRDRLHWRCKIGDTDSEATMNNGTLEGLTANTADFHGFEFVQPWVWWKMHGIL
jgi:hypothetical protein